MKSLLLLPWLLAAASTASAMSLEQYLDRVVKSHRGLEAMRVAREAAEDKKTAGDVSLIPVLSLSGSYLDDKKQPNQLQATEAKSTIYSAALAKKFATGTSVSLTARAMEFENPGAVIPTYGAFSQGALGVSIEQSLWKDAFGRGTRLRREREETTATAEAGGYDLQSRQILASAEAAYWNYVYALEELKLRKASLTRAQRIETWIRRRVADGISDRSDMLSIQALVAGRKLALDNTEDSLVALRQEIRNFLELKEGENFPEPTAKIAQSRDMRALVGGSDGRVMRLDAWLAGLEAKARAIGAQEAVEGTRADLKLAGSYNTNSNVTDGKAADATREWTKTDTPTSQISLTWTYMFDTDVKDAVSASARKQALSARLQAERKLLESETGWSEMERRHRELSRMIASAGNIAAIQSDRAKAFADKLSRGRAVTSDVINSEEDAATAELQLTQLRAEQRKLEAQTRLFVVVKE